MIIRQATIADLYSISHIESVCFPPTEAATKKAIEKRIEVYLDGFLLATENDRVVGFINAVLTNEKTICDEMFSDISQHDPNGNYHAVTSVAVLPEHGGKGIAKKLMNEFIDRTRENGKTGLILTCKENLIAFYKAFGYENLGVSQSKHGGAVWYNMILEF